jgi:hypothetical protein
VHRHFFANYALWQISHEKKDIYGNFTMKKKDIYGKLTMRIRHLWKYYHANKTFWKSFNFWGNSMEIGSLGKFAWMSSSEVHITSIMVLN